VIGTLDEPVSEIRQGLALGLVLLRMKQRVLSVAASNAHLTRILERAAPEFRALKEQALELRDALSDALSGVEVDQAAIERTQHEFDLLSQRGSDLFIATLLEMAQTLSPEQRKWLARRFLA